MMVLRVMPRIVLSGAAQSCSWKEKLPKVMPKMRKPRRLMMRSLPTTVGGVLCSRISSMRVMGLLSKLSIRLPRLLFSVVFMIYFMIGVMRVSASQGPDLGWKRACQYQAETSAHCREFWWSRIFSVTRKCSPFRVARYCKVG